MRKDSTRKIPKMDLIYVEKQFGNTVLLSIDYSIRVNGNK
jgi:hypothetical protein